MVKQLAKQKVNPIHSEDGNIVVLVALVLTILLGSCALVVDLGVIYVNYARLQNALDAAVLAGVQELPTSTTKAQQVALEYAQNNGVPQLSITFALNDLEIKASAQKQVPAFFSRIWGLENKTITASARARLVPPSSMTGVVPLSVKEQDLSYGVEYFLKSGAGGDLSSGWYGALELNGPGAWDYQQFLTYGYSGNLSLGQVLEVEHGNMSGPTQTGIENRLAMDTRTPRNTIDDHERNAPEIVYIPIIKIIETSGNSVQQVQIVGFAAFFIEGVTGNGTESTIQGRFLRTIVPKGQATGSLANLQQIEVEMEQGQLSSDFGLYAAKLLP